MKFIVDNQLPPALVDWLVGKGHQADHVFPLGMSQADDAQIWRWAISEAAIVVTKDADFAQRRLSGAEGPRVLWFRIGNAATAVLLAWLEVRWTEISAALTSDLGVIEVR